MGVDLRAIDVLNRLFKHGMIKDKSVLTLGRQQLHFRIQGYSSSIQWLDDLLIKFGAKQVDSIDVSPYEQPSLVFDLQKPAPSEYFCRWDIILDFGTTEHIFDQKSTFNNIYNFLRPNGICVSIVPRSNWTDHGLYQHSPEFFWTLQDVFPFSIEYFTASVTKEASAFFLYKDYGQDPSTVLELLREDKTYNICFARKNGQDVVVGQTVTAPRYRDFLHKHGTLNEATVEALSADEFIKRPLTKIEKRVGIIHIATGPYKMFTERFVSSGVNGFEPELQKIFYLITDDPNQFDGFDARFNCVTRRFKIDHEPWPNPTLKRFEYIAKLESQLKEDGITHLFFVNANSVFISANPVAELIDAGKPIGFVRHPGFIANPAGATFEFRRESLACVPELNPAAEEYVQGFFYGGETDVFMRMVLELRERVAADLEKGIVAVWHDESHLNWARLCRLREKSFLFNPGYAFPEGWNMESKCHILSLDKSKRMDLSFKE